MADLSKLKRRNTLGAPPSLDEASENLRAPEVAPTVPPSAEEGAPASQPTPRAKGPSGPKRARIDGRSLRKTGRTVQFSSRVSDEFDERLRKVAQRDGLKLVEVLEFGLDAYEADTRLRKVAQRDGLKLVEVLELALDAYEADRKKQAAR